LRSKQVAGGLQVVYSKEDTLQKQQLAGELFRQHNVVSFVARTGLVAACGLLSVVTLIMNAPGVHAQLSSVCASGDRTLTVAGGDTLSSIASRYGMSVAGLAAYNYIANHNFIYTNQAICVPGQDVGGSATLSSTLAAHTSGGGYRIAKITALGNSNIYPYGQCTWWANQRYYQLHGIFVPWLDNAGQWPARARASGWRVSGTPRVGDILALQGGVQGASRLGHVGVVEQVLRNSHVVASSMNWGVHPRAVTRFQFTRGRGVAFIHR
jgi:surface antigen